MIKHLWFAVTLAVSVATTAPALAQDVDDDWRISVTPYLWISAYDGEVSGRPNAPPRDIDVSFGDILDNLSGAFIGKGEIQYKRVGIYADVLYLKLSSDRVIDRAIVGPINAEAELETMAVTGSIFYRVVQSEKLDLDVLAGLRYMEVELELDRSAAGPGVSRAASESFTNGIIGVRATTPIGGRSSLTGYADWGGFSSSKTVWQVYGTYNYQWTSSIIASVGYRYFAIDIDKDEINADIALHGPLVALTFQF